MKNRSQVFPGRTVGTSCRMNGRRNGRREIAMLEVTDATLTKTQKNQILKLILEDGPPPSDFQWTEKQQEEFSSMSYWPYKVSVLTHCPTGYYCTFGAHSVTTCPGITKKVEEFPHHDKWNEKENACGRWLIDLKEEVEAPDLWASIGQEKVLSTAASSPDLDNRPFTTNKATSLRSWTKSRATCWKVNTSPPNKPSTLSGSSHI